MLRRRAERQPVIRQPSQEDKPPTLPPLPPFSDSPLLPPDLFGLTEDSPSPEACPSPAQSLGLGQASSSFAATGQPETSTASSSQQQPLAKPPGTSKFVEDTGDWGSKDTSPPPPAPSAINRWDCLPPVPPGVWVPFPFGPYRFLPGIDFPDDLDISPRQRPTFTGPRDPRFAPTPGENPWILECCPMCGVKLRGYTPLVANVHVNACIDGEDGPLMTQRKPLHTPDLTPPPSPPRAPPPPPPTPVSGFTDDSTLNSRSNLPIPKTWRDTQVEARSSLAQAPARVSGTRPRLPQYADEIDQKISQEAYDYATQVIRMDMHDRHHYYCCRTLPGCEEEKLSPTQSSDPDADAAVDQNAPAESDPAFDRYWLEHRRHAIDLRRDTTDPAWLAAGHAAQATRQQCGAAGKTKRWYSSSDESDDQPETSSGSKRRRLRKWALKLLGIKEGKVRMHWPSWSSSRSVRLSTSPPAS